MTKTTTNRGAPLAALLALGLALATALTMPASADAAPATKGADKVQICHIPPGNPDNAHTIEVGHSAVRAHLAHGDFIGACDGDDGSSGDDSQAGTDDDSGSAGESGDDDSGEHASNDDGDDDDSGEHASNDDGGDDDGGTGSGGSDDGEQAAGPGGGSDDGGQDQAAGPGGGDTGGAAAPLAAGNAQTGPCAHLFDEDGTVPGFYVLATGNLDGDTDFAYFYRAAGVLPDCRIVGPAIILNENPLE